MLVVGVVFGFLLFYRVQDPPPKAKIKHDTITKTIYKDTGSVKIIYKNNFYFDTLKLTDTLYIVKDYSEPKSYDTTFSQNEIDFSFNATVQFNRLKYTNFHLKNKRATKTIVQVAPVTKKKINHYFITLDLEAGQRIYNPTSYVPDYLDFAIGGVLYRKRRLYSLRVAPLSKGVRFGVGWEF